MADAPSSLLTARFLKDDATSAHIRGNQSLLSFNRPEYTQRDDGAIVKLSDTELTGDALVKDIHGSEDFAMGRWAAGVFTSKTGTPLTFDESGGGSFHYVMVNSVAAIPTTGTVTCDAGAFTRPTAARIRSGAQVPGPGQASGSATLAFGTEGASFNVSISATRGDKTAQRPFTGTIRSASAWHVVGGFTGTGAFVKLGRATGDKYLLVGTYAIEQGDGSEFMGAFTFRCG